MNNRPSSMSDARSIYVTAIIWSVSEVTVQQYPEQFLRGWRASKWS